MEVKATVLRATKITVTLTREEADTLNKLLFTQFPQLNSRPHIILELIRGIDDTLAREAY